jgi:fucose permease
MLVFGMILALPATVIGLPEFTGRFQLTLAARGTFIAALFSGLLVGSILSGAVVDRAGYRRAIAGSTAAIALLLPVFALADTFGLALGALCGVGLSSATLNTAANALSSDLFPEERGRRMTLLAMAFSVGGLLLPTAIAAAAHLVSWRTVIFAGAALAAAIAATALFAPGVAAVRHAPAGAGLRTVLRQPGISRFCLLLACGAANEGVFAGWTSSYLSASGFSPVVATWGLSSHWLGLLVGRVVFARRVDHAKAAAIIRGALSGAAVLLVLILVPVPAILSLGPFVVGVAIAVVVPTSLALAGERSAGNAGALFGLLLTMAQVGGMVLPPLIGVVAEATSLRLALVLGVANAVIIARLALESSR